MSLLLVLLELFVATLAVWVLTFEIALYGRVSIATLGIAFPLSWALFLAVMARPWLRRIRGLGRGELAFARDMLALGALVGVLILATSRPDADDVGFMHPILVDAMSPDQPFALDPFVVRFGGRSIEVPFFNENEAYEALVVVLAERMGIEPIQLYHNVFAFLAAIVWVVTYALLFRRFRVPRDRVALAVLTAVAFLLLDGNLHRSFGNFSLLRIWQGKIIAFSILLPVFMLFALRFLARPSRYRGALVLATAAASIFVNRSTLFALAVLGTALAIAYLIAYAGARRRRRRAFVLAVFVLSLWAIGAYIVSSALPAGDGWSALVSSPSSIAGGEDGPAWWRALYDSMHGSLAVLARDVLILLVVPWLAVPRPLGRFLPVLSLTTAALAFSPPMGAVWLQLLDRVYWRLYHALPLPLCAGLLVCLLWAPGRPSRRIAGRALAVFVALVTVLAVERPALSPANAVELKRPFEYRFREQPLAFARAVAPRLRGHHVLAPDEVAHILALTEHDTIELAFTRVTFTWRAASTKANRALADCRITPQTASAVRLLLDRGADAVITARCDARAIRRLGELIGGYRLEEAAGVGGAYRLFWVRPPAVSLLPPAPVRSEGRSSPDPGLSAQTQLSRRG